MPLQSSVQIIYSMRESWEIKKLGDCCNIQTGKLDANARVENGKYPFYTCDSQPYRIDTYAFDAEAILISGNGSLVGHVNYYKGKFNAYQRTYVLTEFSSFYIPYLIHFLKQYIRPYIMKNKKGGCIPYITLPILKNFLIPCPPLPEQESIVAELDCLSGVIEKQKRQLKELDNLAQSIFYATFGDPKSDNFGWGLDTIGNLCTLKSGDSGANNTSEGDLPYVKVGDMNIEANNPYITTSSTFVSREENKKRILPVGTTIFPKRGGAIYTNKKRLTAVEICCDLNTMGVIPKEKVLPQFIYHYFLHLDFGELCNGATIPQINNIDIAPLVICTPPLSVQQEFASKVEAIEKQKDMIKQSIEETETLFNSRMDYYFN